MTTRREFVQRVSIVGAAGWFGVTSRPAAAEPPPETTTLRVARLPALCEAPAQVAEGLFRGEGFSDVQYVADTPPAVFRRLASGDIHLGLITALVGVMRIDAGDPVVLLAGVHVGCFELLGHDSVRTIRDLKGKVVVVPMLGGTPYMLIASMATYVGLDPHKDITWAVRSGREAMQFFIDRKADAFMGFPPEPQELRARKVGHVVVSTTLDRPWSQYFCCMLMANREFVRKHPSATKRAIRAILKADEVCALEPETTARLMVDRGYADRYDMALEVIKGIPYGKWREHDAEDTVRFFALRLREAGIIKSTPQKIIAQGTDWRFLNELKKELKG
jgi:NitT/TauT family transport system substrate-binding protein